MADKISIFESAHKGDYELVTKKVEENPKLITKTDEVSAPFTKKTQFLKKQHFRAAEFYCIGPQYPVT